MAELVRYREMKDAIVRLAPRLQAFALWRFMRAARFDAKSVYGYNARRFFFLMITHGKTELLRKIALEEFSRICKVQNDPSPFSDSKAAETRPRPKASEEQLSPLLQGRDGPGRGDDPQRGYPLLLGTQTPLG